MVSGLHVRRALYGLIQLVPGSTVSDRRRHGY
jgi:hypothetical protein